MAGKLRLETYQLCHSLFGREPFLTASLGEFSRKCGKSNCHCSRDGRPHAVRVLRWTEEGKTKVRGVRPEEWGDLSQLTERYRQFRVCRHRLVKLHKEMLKLIHAAEKERQIRPK